MNKIYLLALSALALASTSVAELSAQHSALHHKKEHPHTSLSHAEHSKEHAHANFWAGGSLTLWRDKEAKETILSFRPEFGYFINKQWGVGLMGNYTSEEAGRVYGITPFVRRYVFEKQPFNIYFDAGVGLSWSQAKVDHTWAKTKLGYEVGIRPGVCLDLAKGLCLCLRMGFVGYRDSFTSGEEHEITHHGFGLRFAPEEIQIGLEFEF